MKIRQTDLFGILTLVGMTLTTTNSYGEADPVWLKSWNESAKSRPLILTPSGRITAEKEPGSPLIIHGRLLSPDGTSASGVVVHAYHRDNDGFEFGPGDRSLTTWKLQGWVKTDDDGRFEFQTIRPAPDHLGREGSHIHFTLDSANFGRQWATKIFFSDDLLVTEVQHRRSKEAGEFGGVREVRTVDNVQHINVNIRLKDKADF